MRKSVHYMMIQCRKAAELTEKERHCRLQLTELMQLKLHLLMCKYCRRYKKQTGLIDQLLSRSRQSLLSSTEANEREKI